MARWEPHCAPNHRDQALQTIPEPRQTTSWARQMRALRGSADALGQRDDDPFRPPDVGHPPSALVLVLADATDLSNRQACGRGVSWTAWRSTVGYAELAAGHVTYP